MKKRTSRTLPRRMRCSDRLRASKQRRGPDPWRRKLEGRAHVREGLASRFAGIPDVHYGEERHWVAGDRGCSEWLLTGTSMEGKKIEVRGCDLFEFRRDKIVCKDSYWKIVEA